MTNISRSDSIVTVPIYHKPGSPNLCPGGLQPDSDDCGFFAARNYAECSERHSPRAGSANGKIEGVIMNVAGCNTGAGNPVLSGGGVSPIPVRLIHQ